MIRQISRFNHCKKGSFHMQPQNQKIPAHYEQPVQCSGERRLDGTLEYVEFIPESHIRIYYNNKTEGYATHHHDAMEIIICVENKYTVVANNKTYELNAGDILILPPHMLHEIICDSPGVRFIFLIDIELFNYFQEFKAPDIDFSEPYLCNATLHSEIHQQVYSYFMQMTDIYFSNNIFWEASIYALLLQTMIMLARDHFYKNAERAERISADMQREHYEKFSNLLKYIDANYAEDLTLEQAANYIGFSKYHFSRLFKQHTRTTFYNYLCRKRIQTAQSMLALDTPITDIAFQTGFNNLTTFCRCFKKYTDCSPTEYRNKFCRKTIH